MYLTRVALDITNRNTLQALSSPSKFHGAISSSFAGERPPVLWRIDSLGGRLYLMILSDEKPELTELCEQFSSSACWETKSCDALLDRLTAGSTWRFRLTANPTRSICDKAGKRGKVVAHITSEHQKNWLIEKSSKNGFAVNSESFDVVQSKWQRFYKSGSKYVTILSVTYEGILEITDSELFRQAMTKGIGRGKAYGMGLMTVMSAQR